MTCEKFERVTMRGADQPLRSLAEAFPEFFEALFQITDAHSRCVWNGELNGHVAQARAVLKRMKGETP